MKKVIFLFIFPVLFLESRSGSVAAEIVNENKLSFIEKFAGTSWTNGTDTIIFKHLNGEISNWSDVVGPEMWYLHRVDGPFFILPCEQCYTGNECHMCGYNAIRFNDDSIELFWDFQNDFLMKVKVLNFIPINKMSFLVSFIGGDILKHMNRQKLIGFL